MRARKMVLGGLMVVLLTGLVGCGSSSSSNAVGGKQGADLVVSDKAPFYDPADLTIPQNKESTLTVFNDGKKVHNITIPGFAIDMDVEPGQSISVKIPATGAPRDGFFTMYCKYHQSEGEAGKLKIAK